MLRPHLEPAQDEVAQGKVRCVPLQHPIQHRIQVGRVDGGADQADEVGP
jgi:hypothetical protein